MLMFHYRQKVPTVKLLALISQLSIYRKSSIYLLVADYYSGFRGICLVMNTAYSEYASPFEFLPQFARESWKLYETELLANICHLQLLLEECMMATLYSCRSHCIHQIVEEQE